MAYNNNRNSNQQLNPTYKKPVRKTFNFLINGTDIAGVSYNTNTAKELLKDLLNADVFNKLSVGVTCPKSVITGNLQAKGVVTVARMCSVDLEAGTVDIVFFGKNVDSIQAIGDNAVLLPRVRTDKKTGDVISFFGFELVVSNETK